MDSDQPEVWLLQSFIWLLFYCTINATESSDGSCFIELEIRSSLGEMTSENQEGRLFSQGFQCCLPSLCFYSRYGGQSSVTVFFRACVRAHMMVSQTIWEF